MDAIEQADHEVLIGAPNSTQEETERAFLVGLDSEESLSELARLAETAGAGCRRNDAPEKNSDRTRRPILEAAKRTSFRLLCRREKRISSFLTMS